MFSCGGIISTIITSLLPTPVPIPFPPPSRHQMCLHHVLAVSAASSHRLTVPSTTNHGLAVPGASDRLPVHAAARASMVRVVSSTSMAVRMRRHGTTRTVSSIARRTTPRATLERSPTGLAREDSVMKAIERAGTGAVDEGRVAQERDVVEAEVPYRGIDHAVRAEGHEGTNDGAGEDVVPVVVLVNRQCAADQASAQHWCIDGDKLPHCWVVVGENLELCVQVKVQENEASEGSGCVTGRHGLEAVVDLVLVASADAAVEHDLAVPIGDVANLAVLIAVVCATNVETLRDDGLADGKEVRAKTTDKPLDEDLKYSSRDERVEQADGGVVDIPEAAGADLHDQEDREWNAEGHECCSPDRDDL